MRERLRVRLSGAVQGVGFRPFVYRLATEMGLAGWVLNSNGGLVVEVEGERQELNRFGQRLASEKPEPAVVLASETARLGAAGYTRFEILSSDEEAERTVSVLPDLATCPECLKELREPANRRYQYPFTNCTHCGPRYTIVSDIPYDRERTTMRSFTLCAECRREYEDPFDRRFHAQPNACPECGPKLAIPLAEAAAALTGGRIVALKGIGGFQLLVDARNADAVARLRVLKHREEKPFALMMPSLDVARQYCEVSEAEGALLRSPAAPIVLLRPKPVSGIAENVSVRSPFMGVMLPYSPLHHLLMERCRFPVVATSGNRSDEPIAIDNAEAELRLGGIADVFLMHDRPIARACDDSVARVIRGRVSVVRRARGYAPLPVRLNVEMPPVLAVGAHLKSTVAIAVGRQVFLSQHIGDLDTLEARQAFERAIDDLCRLYRFNPEIVACDLHPDYASTRWARESGLPVVAIQHHHAHAAACAAENEVGGPYLAVAWDGTGYGTDGTVWGGEFFRCAGGEFERVEHLRPFRLPGGEAAVREGWRPAAGLLWELKLKPPDPLIARMLERGLNAPLTSSVGRLFDAVASMAGVAHRNRTEGQAAMLLENAIGGLRTEEAYLLPGGDWEPLVRAVFADVGCGAGVIAARFHNALANWIVSVAERIALADVVLSGGCFQNAYLVERAAALLEKRGFRAHTHHRVPPGDGGIALGQAVLSVSQRN